MGIRQVAYAESGVPDPAKYQVTEYTYGVLAADTTASSDINSNDLLREIIYPDGTASTNSVLFGYNLQSETIAMNDQNDSDHVYTRDLLGRITLDAITTFGNVDLDQTVKSIGTSYNGFGLVTGVSSFNTATPTPVSNQYLNDVQYTYDDLWQVTKIEQEFAGEVDVNTLSVDYTYTIKKQADGNYSRPATMVYPDGWTLTYSYGGASTPDSRISRLLKYSDTSVPQSLLVRNFVGLSRDVICEYPEPDIEINQHVAHNGKRLNTRYAGLDRFGRVIEHKVIDGAFTEHASDTTLPDRPPIVEIAYTYDDDSNRLTAYDNRTGNKFPRSLILTYDGLDRLTKSERGEWDGTSHVRAANTEHWVLDRLGNFKEADQDLNNDGDTAADTDEEENWDHGDLAVDANELEERSLVNQAQGGGDLDLALTYDDNGNMITEERAKPNGTALLYQYEYDAWNRLTQTEVGPVGSEDLRAQHEYNGLNWLIVRQFDTAADGTMNQQRIRYYSAGWQLLEERVDEDAGGFPTDPDAVDNDKTQQYLWGPNGINHAVRMRADTDFDGTYDDTYYYACDVLGTPVAILDDTAALVGRLAMDAYGGDARHINAYDGDYDGATTLAEIDAITTHAGDKIEDAAYEVYMDADRDGDVDSADFNIANAIGVKSALAEGFISARKAVDNQIGFTGHLFDSDIKMYCARNRHYHPKLSRFIQRDPAGYVDGMNLYQYAGDNPASYTDPSGTVIVGFTGLGNVDPAGILESTAAGLAAAVKGEKYRIFNDGQRGAAARFVRKEMKQNCDQGVVLFGFSWGGDAAVQTANILQGSSTFPHNRPSITVDYLVTLDPVSKLPYSGKPRNVVQADNFFQKMGQVPHARGRSGWGARDHNVGPFALATKDWSATHVLTGPNRGEDRLLYWAFHVDVPRMSTKMQIGSFGFGLSFGTYNWVAKAQIILRNARPK